MLSYGLWWILKILTFPITFLLGPIKQRGKLFAGPCIVICNHPSLYDPVVLFLNSPRFLIFLGAAEVFNIPIIGSILRLFKVIPIQRGSVSSARHSMNAMVESLKSGQTVAMFPEGETGTAQKIRKLHKGFLWIAKKANVPIQTVVVKNTHLVIPYKKCIPRPAFKTIELIWGDVFYVDQNTFEEEMLQKIQDHLQFLIENT